MTAGGGGGAAAAAVGRRRAAVDVGGGAVVAGGGGGDAAVGIREEPSFGLRLGEEEPKAGILLFNVKRPACVRGGNEMSCLRVLGRQGRREEVDSAPFFWTNCSLNEFGEPSE